MQTNIFDTIMHFYSHRHAYTKKHRTLEEMCEHYNQQWQKCFNNHQQSKAKQMKKKKKKKKKSTHKKTHLTKAKNPIVPK